MRLTSSTRIIVTLASVAIIASFALSAAAQKRPKSDKAGEVTESKRSPRFSKIMEPARSKPLPRPKPTPANDYGIVEIFPALEGAKVLVDGKPVSDDAIEMDKASRRILITKLPPGEHKITYDHPDYVIVEQTFQISPGKEYLWSFIPERATVELRVSSEPGVEVYIDNKYFGEVREDGKFNTRVIQIGKHEVKLSKEGYEEYKDTLSFEYGKPVEVTRSLVPVATSAAFIEDFDLNLLKWSVPPASALRSPTGRLNLSNATDLIQAKGIRYRDFIMQFHLKLENAGGAAWAVRADKDAKNYYLFYLSGPQGLFPNRFLTYIVRDGKFDPQSPASTVPVIMEIKAGGQYTVEVRAIKDVITHVITPATTGKPENLGYFKDPGNLFQTGSIGFRTVRTESFSIDDLIIQPLEQPR